MRLNTRSYRVPRAAGLMAASTVLLVVVSTAAPRAADAQAPTSSANVQTVMVMDFTNSSGFGGQALARLATDAVAVELASSDRFEVLKRDEVARAAANLDLRPPFDTIALSKMAQQLGATSIVVGDVAQASVERKADPWTVSVGLRVELLEAGYGDPVNGAAEIGIGRARPGDTDEQVVAQEAVKNAATLAVRSILQYNLPEGIVLTTVGSGSQGSSLLVLINRGSRDGVKEGMEMLVLRDRQRVGRLRVTRVYPTDAETVVTENALGVRPEDRVRAVFPLPDFPEHRRHHR